MIESQSQERTGPGTARFNKEFEKAIKAMLRRGYETTPDNVFAFIRAHPADHPFIMSRIILGLEPHLRVYIHLWSQARGSVMRKATQEEIDAEDGLGLATKAEDESMGPMEVDFA